MEGELLKIFLWQAIYDFCAAFCHERGGWAHHGIHGKIFTVTKNITSGRLISKKYGICDLSMDTGNSLTYKNTYFWWAKSCKTVDIVISHYLGCVSTIPNGTVCYLRKWILTGSVWMLQTNYRVFLVFFGMPPPTAQTSPKKKENREMTWFQKCSMIFWKSTGVP